MPSVKLNMSPGDDVRVECHDDGKVTIRPLLAEQSIMLDAAHAAYMESREAMSEAISAQVSLVDLVHGTARRRGR